VASNYQELHRSFAPIWQQEETERGERWNQWIQSFRNLEKAVQEDDSQLMERALSHYDHIASVDRDGGNLEETELLQQLRALVQMGIPINRRAPFWPILLNINSKKKPNEYLSLVQAALNRHGNTTLEDCFCVTPLDSNNDSSTSSPVTPSSSTPRDQCNEIHEDWMPQIDKDLHRTFPDHPMMDTAGKAALRRILSAYSVRNPEVGYCQGLNFLAAMFMLLFNEEDAFWCVVVLVEDLLPGYFDLKMIAQQVDGHVLAHLLRGSAPRVAQHLNNLQVDIPSATSAWFLVAFINSLPVETCLRVWDVFFFERSAVVLFRSALALIDIYSQALLETDDSSEAYLLLQALGPMSFDSSRLVDSACIGFGHVNDAALRVLREKYRPEVLERMESMFSCNEELQSYFESANFESALSRSQSFTESLAAAAARSAAASSIDAGATKSSLSRDNSIVYTTPLSATPISPLSRYNSSKSTLDAAVGSSSPRHGSNSSSPLGKQPSLSPLGPQHTTQNASSLSSQMKDQLQQQQQQLVRSTSPLLFLRRSASAATLGGAAVRRSHSSMHHYVQRIDLHSLAAFTPDLSHPKVAALYRIAATKPSPRKKTLIAAAAAEGASTINLPSNKSTQQLYLPWESALAQLPQEFQAAVINNNDGGGGATIDIGGLAGLIKALKYGQTANQNAASGQKTGGGETDEGQHAKKVVLRRVTDGGALFGKKEMKFLAAARNIDTLSKISPLGSFNSSMPPSSGSNSEKLEQLERLRDELAIEVAAAGRRQAAAMETAIDAVDTAEALHRQLTKMQTEIDVKVGDNSYN
jgi:hypothetical protein